MEETVVRYGRGIQRAAAPPPSRTCSGRENPARPVGEVGCRADPRIGFHDVDDLNSYATPGTKINAEQLPARKVEGNLPSDLAVTNAGDASCD